MPVTTSRAPGTTYLGAGGVLVAEGAGVGVGVVVAVGAAVAAGVAVGGTACFAVVEAVAGPGGGVTAGAIGVVTVAAGDAVFLRDRCLWVVQYLKYPPLNLCDVVALHPTAAHWGACAVKAAVGELSFCTVRQPRKSQ